MMYLLISMNLMFQHAHDIPVAQPPNKGKPTPWKGSL